MQVEQLTPNGIQRFLKGEKVILQILETSQEIRGRQNEPITMYKATISDGFAYLQQVFFYADNFINHDRVEYFVLSMKLIDSIAEKIAKNKKVNSRLVDPNNLTILINSYGEKIGDPIRFEEYLANGKKNPRGSRKIYVSTKRQKQEQTETEEDQYSQLYSNQQKIVPATKPNKQVEVKPAPKSNIPPSKPNHFKKQEEDTSNTMRTDGSNSRRNQNSFSAASRPSKTVQPKKKTYQATLPIIKAEHSEQSRSVRKSIKPEVSHHDNDHQKIKQLFLNMENFKIIARLLFIWPLKMITSKKGNQSQLLNLQFGDQTGTIMCTAFGDNASRYSTLEVDKIYGITGAAITESSFRGTTEMKLTFNDSTKLTIISNCKNIPQIEKFCLNLRELSETEKGRVVSVSCCVKQGEMTEFVSKNGNNIKKKTLKLLDTGNCIECQLSLINEKAQLNYPDGHYAIKGVEVDEYQGKKQFKASLIFVARLLRPFGKKENQQIEDLTFTNIGSNIKKKGETISSFSVLNQKAEDLQLKESLWSEVVCYLKAIKIGGNSKNFYLGCPFCRRKILEESATDCPHCKKDFDRPKYRYLLQVNLMDDHDNIWASTSDQGEKILSLPGEQAFTADRFAQSSEETLRERIQMIRYKQLKLKIVSNKEEFNGEQRLKHKIIKIMPLDFGEECKGLLERVKGLMSCL